MNLEDVLKKKGVKKTKKLVDDALTFVESREYFTWFDLQQSLRIGVGEARALYRWLYEQHLAEPSPSAHAVRCGRRYVLNNHFPSLEDMCKALRIGDRQCYAIMMELEYRKIIRISVDFSFERVKRMSSWDDLVRQLLWVSKKYGGRCEPKLLMRILYVDVSTAIRLAQYGEENLDLMWKNRPRDLY